MKRLAPTKADALRLLQKLKKHLVDRGIPVREVYLFGSLARNEPHEWSDIDVAIVHDQFADDRFEERAMVLQAEGDIDVRIETICLHPEDLANKYSTIVQEIKKEGIAV